MAEDVRTDFTRAAALHRQGQLDEAIDIYRRLLKRRPGLFEVERLLVFAQLQAGRVKQAHAAARKARQAHRGNPHAHVLLGATLQAERKFADALAAFEQACTLDPGLMEAQYLAGNMLASLERHAEAALRFSRVIALDPRAVEAVANRAAALVRLDRRSEALEDLERLCALQPWDPAHQLARGALLLDLDRPAEAIAAAEVAIALRNGLADGHYLKGRALLASGDMAAAGAAFRAALAAAPDRPAFKVALARLEASETQADAPPSAPADGAAAVPMAPPPAATLPPDEDGAQALPPDAVAEIAPVEREAQLSDHPPAALPPVPVAAPPPADIPEPAPVAPMGEQSAAAPAPPPASACPTDAAEAEPVAQDVSAWTDPAAVAPAPVGAFVPADESGMAPVASPGAPADFSAVTALHPPLADDRSGIAPHAAPADESAAAIPPAPPADESARPAASGAPEESTLTADVPTTAAAEADLAPAAEVPLVQSEQAVSADESGRQAAAAGDAPDADAPPLVWHEPPAPSVTPDAAAQAFSDLAEGRWHAGWAGLESQAAAPVDPLPFPRWDGTSGATTLVVAGEGEAGELILFGRLLRLLADRGLPARLLTGAGAVALLSRIDARVPVAADLAGVDVRDRGLRWVPLASLPGLIAPDPAFWPRTPFLTADPARIARWRHVRSGGFTVGIAWDGDAALLAAFVGLAQMEGVELVALDAGPLAEAQLAELDFGDRVARIGPPWGQGDRLSDLAAAIQHVDLVVTGAGAVAHLAGARGRPAVVALADDAHWCWGRAGAASPFYPALDLVRTGDAADARTRAEALRAAVSARLGARV